MYPVRVWCAQGDAEAKPEGSYVGTAFEVSPRYPTMYKRSAPGDIGWAADKNEHWYANVNGTESISTIASCTHNRTSGYHSKIADVEVRNPAFTLFARII